MWLKGTRCKDAKTFKQGGPESYCRAHKRFCILVTGIQDRSGGSHQGLPTVYPSSEFAGPLSLWPSSSGAPVSHMQAGGYTRTLSGPAAASSQPLLGPGCFSGLVRSSQPDPGSPETFPEPSRPSTAAPHSCCFFTMIP